MNETRQVVETVNFRLYFKVIIRPLSSAEAFVFQKNRGKEGKAEKRERRKNGKGGKSAREREKRRKSLPDFCRNMVKVVDILPHTA